MILKINKVDLGTILQDKSRSLNQTSDSVLKYIFSVKNNVKSVKIIPSEEAEEQVYHQKIIYQERRAMRNSDLMLSNIKLISLSSDMQFLLNMCCLYNSTNLSIWALNQIPVCY